MKTRNMMLTLKNQYNNNIVGLRKEFGMSSLVVTKKLSPYGLNLDLWGNDMRMILR